MSSNALDVALAKRILPLDQCNTIETHFFMSERRERRPDNVSGYMLGRTDSLALETGDLAIINGRFIHAVTRSPSKRVVIHCFATQMPSSEYVYWT